MARIRCEEYIAAGRLVSERAHDPQYIRCSPHINVRVAGAGIAGGDSSSESED
jgi:hypothetical protein